MVLLEIVLYILSLFILVILFMKKYQNKQFDIFVLSLFGLLEIVHFIASPFQWRFYFLYATVCLIWIVYLIQRVLSKSITKWLKGTLVFIIFFSLFLSIGTSYAFPVYDLPTPSGTYQIGTESFVIEDTERTELYNDNVMYRKIKIQLWYPASETKGYQQVPWLEDGQVVAEALSRDTGLPGFVLNQTATIMSHSYLEAPINPDMQQYPVVVISHGWRGFRNLHTDFAEELASFGYIVVSIDHTYGSVATVFGEEDVAFVNLDALPNRETTTEFLTYANTLVSTYASDINTTLNYLESLDSSSRFYNRLDMTKIGLLGHSTGGGADVMVALEDDRIDAVIGLDAWVEPIGHTDLSSGLSIPALFLRSGNWETGYNNDYLYGLIRNSTNQSTLYQIDGTTHYDFSMVYMYSPLTKYIGFTGEVEGRYLNQMLSQMIVSFFDDNVRSNTYSELVIEDWEEVHKIIVE